MAAQTAPYRLGELFLESLFVFTVACQLQLSMRVQAPLGLLFRALVVHFERMCRQQSDYLAVEGYFAITVRSAEMIGDHAIVDLMRYIRQRQQSLDLAGECKDSV